MCATVKKWYLRNKCFDDCSISIQSVARCDFLTTFASIKVEKYKILCNNDTVFELADRVGGF